MKNEENIIILKRIHDMLWQSAKNGEVIYSHFLTPAQQSLILSEKTFRNTVSFEGGYPDAERRIARIAENETCWDNGADIILFHIQSSDKNAELNHRNILGSLMGLGIKREMIGDILSGTNGTQFFCCGSVSEYIRLNLRKIAKYPVTLKQSDFQDIILPKKEIITINISSMRLDCICAECFHISRTKAAAAISQGLVTLNWVVCCENAKEITIGDRIALRGKGKIQIDSIAGTSKKNRIFLNIST